MKYITGVRIKDEAIIAAAMLSDRYITSRFLPDKAIDLVDEAASRLKMEIESQPTELDQTERKILQLNIEKQALSKEDDPASKERTASIERELADLKTKRDAMQLQWRNEKSVIEQIREFKQKIEDLRIEETRYEREGNLSKAAGNKTRSTSPRPRLPLKRRERSLRIYSQKAHCFRKLLGKRILQKLYRHGQVFLFQRCFLLKCRNISGLKNYWKRGLSVRRQQ